MSKSEVTSTNRDGCVSIPLMQVTRPSDVLLIGRDSRFKGIAIGIFQDQEAKLFFATSLKGESHSLQHIQSADLPSVIESILSGEESEQDETRITISDSIFKREVLDGVVECVYRFRKKNHRVVVNPFSPVLAEKLAEL